MGSRKASVTSMNSFDSREPTFIYPCKAFKAFLMTLSNADRRKVYKSKNTEEAMDIVSR